MRRAIDGKEGVAELAAPYPMSFAAVQKHIAVLERAGLVRKRTDGRRRLVTTDMDGLRSVGALMEEYEALWRGRAERMQELLEQIP